MAGIQQAAQPIFSALGDDARLRLVTRPSSEGRVSIVRISHRSGLTRHAITKHLRVLAGLGLVQSARHGRGRAVDARPAAAGYRAGVARRNLSPVGSHPRTTEDFRR